MKQRLVHFPDTSDLPTLPSVILILGGTNDLKKVPVTTTVANLQAMHKLAAGWGAVVGVLALPRFLDPKVGSASKRSGVNDALADLQRSYRFPSFFVNLTAVPPSHLYDGLHFTSHGYFMLAELIAQKLWLWL
ncbi:unnamed protein product [Symbiodinium pilosum]|uniref:SGNH hydrolase-type esterase domain-containing protein n=1 Tax=Symbiodinium pilosum TaxID=2952 RepID=A0A812VW31_SYMPI|nr:unnamed protein product [Symbiodinium pilosum]